MSSKLKSYLSWKQIPPEYKKYFFYAFLALLGYLYDKRAFLMIVFIASTFILKLIRAQVADNMFMFDPLVFYSIILMYFWGIYSVFIFLFFTVFATDAMSGKFSAGSFVNYGLFHLSPFVCYFIFGRFSLMIFGVTTAIFYSVTYFHIRTRYTGGDPVSTGVKAITNVIFVYLYLVFLGPIVPFIM